MLELWLFLFGCVAGVIGTLAGFIVPAMTIGNSLGLALAIGVFVVGPKQTHLYRPEGSRDKTLLSTLHLTRSSKGWIRVRAFLEFLIVASICFGVGFIFTGALSVYLSVKHQ